MTIVVRNAVLFGLIALFAAIAQSTAPLASAGTEIRGGITISGVTTWRRDASPYFVTGDVYVDAGATLVIEPGVTVRLGDKNGYAPQIFVQGTVKAEGAVGAPVTFTGINGKPGDWDGITVHYPPAQVQLRHVIVENAGGINGDAAIRVGGSLTVSESQIRNNSGLGVATVQGDKFRLAVTDVELTANGGPAIVFGGDFSRAAFSRLTFSGNVVDGIVVSDGARIAEGATVTWRRDASPYVVRTKFGFGDGQSLVIEPGVTVIFDRDSSGELTGLEISDGTLSAVGTAAAPITFTGASGKVGDWVGITGISWRNQAISINLRHVIVEHAGSDKGNAAIQVTGWDLGGGALTVSDTQVRNNKGSGIQTDYPAVISESAFINNGGPAIENTGRNNNPVIAPGNWFGAPSGPTSPCNPGGTGAAVVGPIAVMPFATALGQRVTDRTSDAALVTLTPRRWFVPADGTTRLWIDIEVRDGYGRPVPGQKVELSSTAGFIVSGSRTNAEGRTLAYLTASAPAQATVTGWLATDDTYTCLISRGGSAAVSFVPPTDIDALMPEAAAPYLNEGIEVLPLPVTPGQPTTLRAKIFNPNDFPITLDGSFEYATLGIGLTFGPIAEARGVTIPARATGVVEATWTPLVAVNFCIQFRFTAEMAPTAEMDHRSGSGLARPPMRTLSGVSQRNLYPAAGKPTTSETNAAVDKFSEESGSPTSGLRDRMLNVASTTYFKAANGVLVNNGLAIPLLGFKNILLFNAESWTAATCALGGGQDCGGYNGLALSDGFVSDSLGPVAGQLTGLPKQADKQLFKAVDKALGGTLETRMVAAAKKSSDMSYRLGTIRKDPPRADYKTLTPLDPAVPVVQLAALEMALADEGQVLPDGPMRDFVIAQLRLNNALSFALLAQDRYGGAVQARDLEWASLQSDALLLYVGEAGAAAREVADRTDALLTALGPAATADVTVTADEVRTLQADLKATGFSTAQRRIMRAAGMAEDAIDARLRQLVAADATALAGNGRLLPRASATAYRRLADAFDEMASHRLPSVATRTAGRPSGMMRTASAMDGADGELAPQAEASSQLPTGVTRVGLTETEFQVGNPLAVESVVELQLRRVDVPTDWTVMVEPATVTLKPGATTTAVLRVQPGLPAVQGARPRVAVEGIAQGQLLGGVVVDIQVPAAPGTLQPPARPTETPAQLPQDDSHIDESPTPNQNQEGVSIEEHIPIPPCGMSTFTGNANDESVLPWRCHVSQSEDDWSPMPLEIGASESE